MKRMTKIGIYGMAVWLLSACGNGTPDYDATGTFEATEVIVSAEAAGKLLQLEVEEGTRLKAGEAVGLVDTVQLYLKKLQLEASMKSVESQRPDLAKQIAATKQQITTAQREKKRVENLLVAGAANQKQLDDWDAQVTLLQRQLIAQESSLMKSTNSLTEQGNSVGIQVAQVEDQLSKCHIQSPIEGTVLAKYAEAGELASVGKPLFKVGEVDRMYLRAYVTSEQLSQVKLGDEVTVYSDYGNSEQKAYPGVVTWISDRSEFTPKTILTKNERANLVYAVKIAVKNDGSLKIGMYGGVVWKRRTHSRCKRSQQELRESRGTERDFFAVEQGEIFGLIGPDGAGKSTLFRILTTLLLADKGTATVNGLDVVTDYKQIRTKVGYMPGRFSLYQDLSVEENLEFLLRYFIRRYRKTMI